MSTARFKVVAQLDSAGGRQPGLVLIDREAGTFSVRPHGRRTLYTLPLSVVADMVCKSIVLAEHRALHPKKAVRKVARRPP